MNSKRADEARPAGRVEIMTDTNTRPKSQSLTIFHGRENVLQSGKIAASFNFQDPNHVEDNRSSKLH